MNNPVRALLGLSGFALVCAGLLGGIDYMTRERIAENIEQARKLKLLEVVGAVVAPPVEIGELTLEGFGYAEPRTGHVIAQDGAVRAYVLPVRAPDGYSGAIDLLVAVSPDAEPVVFGVRTVQHRETPGLGDGIERAKSDWILSFDGATLEQPADWRVRRDGGDFDQLTGATITPRAVVSAVHRALLQYRRQHGELQGRPVLWEDAGEDAGKDTGDNAGAAGAPRR
ncbi:MAG: RnfABCDGE type electron transport complex subunit G [Gammaproteobacteria bacterium AqS3]|nr:RnfABCDGE type electron transport complex subunit G [Gammaproteobacteria bacterium AqS3]